MISEGRAVVVIPITLIPFVTVYLFIRRRRPLGYRPCDNKTKYFLCAIHNRLVLQWWFTNLFYIPLSSTFKPEYSRVLASMNILETKVTNSFLSTSGGNSFLSLNPFVIQSGLSPSISPWLALPHMPSPPILCAALAISCACLCPSGARHCLFRRLVLPLLRCCWYLLLFKWSPISHS